MRALPNLAALAAMLAFAQGADEAHALQPEPLSLEIYGTLVLGALAWLVARGVLWAWSR